MKTWSEQAWLAATPIFETITQMPFIQELMIGTLSSERFAFYIRQDSLYLAQYGRVVMGLASRFSDPKHSELFVRFASESIAAERELHNSFTNILGSTEQVIEPSPSCLLYSSYLQSQLATASVEVAAATILPCFRVYYEVGNFVLANQSKGDNPYQNWIDTYGGNDFARDVAEAEAACDTLAAACTEDQRRAMTQAYLMCARLEWVFWDSAYRLEQWGV